MTRITPLSRRISSTLAKRSIIYPSLTCLQKCHFSSQSPQLSHPDFEPQRKEPSGRFQKKMEDLQDVIEREIDENPVILFMKGSAAFPQCGFSRAVVQVLDTYNIKYATRDMNADIPMKEALKVFSDWPTIPQLYVNGEFVGGCDIVMQMHKDGELEDVFEGIERKEKKKRDLV